MQIADNYILDMDDRTISDHWFISMLLLNLIQFMHCKYNAITIHYEHYTPKILVIETIWLLEEGVVPYVTLEHIGR